jgi:hypothetical protein
VVTLRTTNSDKKNPTFCIFLFHINLGTNSNFSRYTAAGVCLLRGTDWPFMESSAQFSSLSISVASHRLHCQQPASLLSAAPDGLLYEEDRTKHYFSNAVT